MTCIPQGPKLGKFKDGKHKKVQFVKGLGSGAHSHVWKVKIDSRVYALKMFRHIRAEEENAASAAKLERLGIDLQLLNDQLTPFNCEARAYGRLKETGNEDIAWKCYGYIALDEATYSSIVWDKIGLPRKDWFSQYTNTDEEVADRPVFPILALVKEFIPDASKLGALDMAKAHDMAQNINKLHSIGITHRDIQDRNYVDSRIMDFSTSWTVPNIRLDRALKWDPKQLIDEADTNDYFMFDDMIEKWNNEHPDLPPSDYRMTQGEKYRPVTKAPGAKRKSTSSSGSSEEMEEIPIMERMRDNRYLVLASSYDWVGKKPAVAQPDIIAPPTPARKDGGGQRPGLPTPPRWPPLGFYVPDSPIAGFPPADSSSATRFPTPDPAWTPPSTTEATVPGPSTLDRPPQESSTPTPGPRNLLADFNRTPPRGREAGKLTAVREAAGNISSTCEALKAMADNLIRVIDSDDSVPSDGGDHAPPETQQQQQQQQAAQPLARMVRPSRRRPRPDNEDNGVDNSAPTLRRLRPRRK